MIPQYSFNKDWKINIPDWSEWPLFDPPRHFERSSGIQVDLFGIGMAKRDGKSKEVKPVRHSGITIRLILMLNIINLDLIHWSIQASTTLRTIFILSLKGPRQEGKVNKRIMNNSHIVINVIRVTNNYHQLRKVGSSERDLLMVGFSKNRKN